MPDEIVEPEGAGYQRLEPGTDLTPVPLPPPTTLFRTDDPALVLTRATETAEALMPVVRAKGLTATISGREHLKVEAWQTLGAMLGVTAVCVWTKELAGAGWEARVEARTLDGRVIGAAEAECMRAERQWSNRDDFALRSMAQTRATSKALASVLRFVATLGGAEGTPAEEMPAGATSGAQAPPGQTSIPTEPESSPAQRGKVTKLLKASIPPEFHVKIKKAFHAGKARGAGILIELLEADNVVPVYERAGITPPSDVPDDPDA